MKKVKIVPLCVFVFLLFNSFTLSIQKPVVTVSKTSRSVKEDTMLLIEQKNFLLLLQNNRSKSTINFDWQKNMPWIGAILIGVFAAAANIYSTRILRRTNLENTTAQLDNATRISIAQIELLRKNSEREFNKTVLSGNRQLWINEFRILISEIISLISQFIIKENIDDIEFSDIKTLLIKAELMLNEETDITFVNTLIGFESYCFEVLKKNLQADEFENYRLKIKTQALTKIKMTWEKVKNGI